MTTRAEMARRLGVWLPFVVGAVVLTCAGLLWLHQSSRLAATGRRIYSLEMQRQELQQRRSTLLVRYASASDPRHLEQRAIEMGFGPSRNVLQLPVVVERDAEPLQGLASYEGPIRLVHGFSSASGQTSRGTWERVVSSVSGRTQGADVEITAAGGVAP